MIRATIEDKPAIVEILAAAFDTNKSVNFIVKQDDRRKERIQKFMEYAFYYCFAFGDIFLSDDRKGCALLIYPEKKKFQLANLWQDIKFGLFICGVTKVNTLINREKKLKKHYPTIPYLYLYFLGIHPSAQKKGIGKTLLKEIIHLAKEQNRPIYLETSIPNNLIFYQNQGFKVYAKENFGYILYLLSND